MERGLAAHLLRLTGHVQSVAYCSSETFSIHSTFLPSSVLVMAMCDMLFAAVAPCQCFTPGGAQTTSPGLISRFAPPSSCTHPVPDMTMSVCPPGWVCQAERAPGSNVTRPPLFGVCSLGPWGGSGVTAPVKFAPAPVGEGREPFGEITVLSAWAAAPASRVRVVTVARSVFI